MMVMDEDQRSLLLFFNENAEYQINTWAIPADRCNIFRLGSDLRSLQRRGLIDGEGRGRTRQWWITDKGKAALNG